MSQRISFSCHLRHAARKRSSLFLQPRNPHRADEPDIPSSMEARH